MTAIAALTAVATENATAFERTEQACQRFSELGSSVCDVVSVPLVCQLVCRAAADIMRSEQSVLVTFNDAEATLTAYSGRYPDWRFSRKQQGTQV